MITLMVQVEHTVSIDHYFSVPCGAMIWVRANQEEDSIDAIFVPASHAGNTTISLEALPKMAEVMSDLYHNGHPDLEEIALLFQAAADEFGRDIDVRRKK